MLVAPEYQIFCNAASSWADAIVNANVRLGRNGSDIGARERTCINAQDAESSSGCCPFHPQQSAAYKKNIYELFLDCLEKRRCFL